MKKFTFFWLYGEREVLEGEDVADAARRAGYGAGAISVLDFYSDGDDDNFVYDMVRKHWRKKEEI